MITPARSNSTELLEHESVLLRLFRCMTEGEQEELIVEMLKQLSERYSFDLHYKFLRPDDIELEIKNDDLDERLMVACPGRGPGQQLVDLDNLGDGHAWLDKNFSDPPSEFLFSVPMNYQSIADDLVEPYLSEIVEQGYPVPSDFETKPREGAWTKEDEDFVRKDFEAFFSYWRESIIKAIEKQSQSS
jgi:hypothetical protein